MEKMRELVKKSKMDPEKIMEMLNPAMKAGQQIMEAFLQGMDSASMNQDEQKNQKNTFLFDPIFSFYV